MISSIELCQLVAVRVLQILVDGPFLSCVPGSEGQIAQNEFLLTQYLGPQQRL